MTQRTALYLAAAASLLPLLLLLPLGALWLWQQGWLVPWLLLAALLGGLTYGLSHWLASKAEALPQPEQGPVSSPNKDFSPLDQAAWDSVQQVAREVEPGIVCDRQELLLAARATIEAVAGHYHPEAHHAMWRFTLPELFLLTERVSQRLRRVLLEQVPGSHLLRVGDAMRIWEFKPLVGRGLAVAKGVNLLWRAARLVNPASALLAEARERLVGAALGDAGSWIQQRGARLWVEEVGRAAIELYSGRLGLDAGQLLAADRLPGGLAPAPAAGPVRILVAGQTNAGKSSLINVLLDARAAGVDVLPCTDRPVVHELHRDGEVLALLIDAPGLEGQGDINELCELAWQADALLWVSAAPRADRALDREALDAIRERFAAEPRRSMPPIRVILSQIDRLSPGREWSPPYDVDAVAKAINAGADTIASTKARNIASCMQTVARELDVGVERLLPVRLQDETSRYNTELIWPALAEDLETAGQARWTRLALDADRRQWRQLLQQARSAGRALWSRSGTGPESAQDS